MSQFISVEISAEKIADLMLDCPNFADEMWDTLALYLCNGALRDDLHDLAEDWSKTKLDAVCDNLIEAFQSVKERADLQGQQD